MNMCAMCVSRSVKHLNRKGFAICEWNLVMAEQICMFFCYRRDAEAAKARRRFGPKHYIYMDIAFVKVCRIV